MKKTQESPPTFSLEVYRTLIETIPHVVWVADREGNVTFLSPAWKAWTGREVGDSYGTRWAESIHPDDAPELLAKWKAAYSEGARYEGECRFVGEDGSVKHISFIGSPVRDDEGRITNWVGIDVDITEIKNAEERLQEAHARLEQRVNERTQELERANAEQANLHIELRRLQAQLAHVGRMQAMGELAGALAHELAQPLAASLTYCEASQRFLRQPKPDLDEARVGLASAIEQAVRASDVIERIRSLLRKQQIKKVALDINAVIRPILPLVNSEALDKGVSLQLELAENLPPVLGDAVYLQQVVMNLLLNALAALESDGPGSNEVLLRTLCDQEGAISVAVSDTATGFEAGDEDRLFEPFFTTKTEGLGIGLAVSRTIVEEHGGKLEARRNPDKGATFHFTLPIHEGLERIVPREP